MTMRKALRREMRRGVHFLRGLAYFQPSRQHVFLSSFPRSGNTWMRTVFAALASGRPVESIVDLDRIVPEDDVPVMRWRLRPAKVRFVKTHAMHEHWRDDFRLAAGVVYIVRDPRDVVVSHWAYHRAYFDLADDINGFVDDWLAGRYFPGSWIAHVKNWTAPGTTRPQRIVTVRYEDLQTDCAGQVARICGELGLEFSEAAIGAAVAQASFDAMRAMEQRGTRSWERADGHRFLRSGRSGGWREKLSPDALSKIEQECGAAMRGFGYLNDVTGP